MDPEWKDQNISPDQSSAAPQPPSKNPTATKPRSQTQAEPSAVDPAAFSYQNVYDAYDPNAKISSPGRKIVVPIIVLALVITGSLGYLFVNKKSGQVANQSPASNDSSASQPQPQTQAQPLAEAQKKEVEVPADWTSADTKLGFSVKIPAGWAMGLTSDFNLKDLMTKAVTISDPKAKEATFISAGSQSLNGTKNQQDFENYLTSGKAFTDLGVSKEEVKLTSKKLDINGRQWLEIDENESTSLSKTLYLWVNDHYVALSAVSDQQKSLDDLTEKYLIPMAASLQIN